MIDGSHLPVEVAAAQLPVEFGAAQLSAELTAPIATAIVGFGSMVIAAGCITALAKRENTGRALATYIGIGLEFFLAAGLIRLASVDTFKMLGIAASILVIRRSIVLGLGFAVRATADPPGSAATDSPGSAPATA